MNLLNKKLKDKIKTLEDIDKQYITSMKNNNHTFKKSHNINHLNSIDLLKKTTNENFDKIYSDFYLNENAYFSDKGNNNKNKKKKISKNKYTISYNNIDNITKEDSMEKDKYNDSLLDKKSNKTYNDETKKIKYKGVEVADRLNNYGIYLKNKIENQRQIQDNKIMQLMKPKKRGKSGNTTKNPEKISERLYQDYKKNIDKNNRNNNTKNNLNNTSGNLKDFTYHPKINKKSLMIAQKLEPSFIRLNKKKKTKEINTSKNKKNDYLNLYGGSLINNNKEKKDIFYNFSLMNNNSNSTNINKKREKNKNNKNIFEKMNNLYIRGIEQKQKKEKVYNDSQKKKEEEYKNYSFKPKINKIYDITRNKYELTEKQKKNNSKKENISNIYKKNFEWKKKIENELKKKKQKKEETLKSLCTFKPIINDYNFNINTTNNKNMSKILEQMNDYINKRRKNIQYKRNEESYKYKRLYGSGNKYEVKSTIPQEFELETEIRNRYMKKNKNRSCDDFHKQNYLLEQYSDKKSISNESNHKYWFFKEKMMNNKSNSHSHSNTRSNNKNNETVSQFDFIEAVNMLHDKLDKLNI